MDDSVQHRGSSGAGTSAGGASDDTRYQEMPDDMAAEDAQAGEGAEGAATTLKRKQPRGGRIGSKRRNKHKGGSGL